ncbi:hypothetical protein A5320_18225 [Rheinheimera sp. SA_1]|uniref:efflux RND transporter permease subunit n=1 Tax=Rheinheimera sp. SA_1 TaxID=1827365 RepID=UPI00080173DF|nr:efflux RND transporter permease subunit [Rheinheimera sp. SA_1]OBP13486.1 hypothetical protein A5320_18225 [Rheinheimera sp. SA_1]
MATMRPVAVSVLALVISVVGYFSWSQLTIDLLPDLKMPTVLISLESGNRPAEQMERMYGERIEQQLFTVPGLQSIEQVVRNGKLICRASFSWDSDIDLALVDVNRAVASLAADPQVDEIKVRRFDSLQLPVITLGLKAPEGTDLAELRLLAKRQLAPNLEQLPGVAEVRVSGGRVKQVQVQLDHSRMRAYGITLAQVGKAIAEHNIDFDAGTLEQQNEVFLVRGRSRFFTPQDVEQVVLKFVESDNLDVRAVNVGDIADVVVKDANITSLVRVNGVEGLGLFIYKEAQSNTVEVAERVKAALTTLNQSMPGLEVSVVSDEAAFIEDAVSDVKSAALTGIVLSVLVLVFFLRSIGPIVIVSLVVPVSLLATVFVMDLTGYSLNLITLAGLALGAGMLVANAIVVIESIFRCSSAGDSPEQAAYHGVAAVGNAIVASTLTTCIVFLPALFIDGLASRLVAGISLTVVVSLLVSLLVAILLVPALSAIFMRNQSIPLDPGADRVERWTYALLGKPRRVLLSAALLSIAAFFALLGLGSELFPPQDPRQITVKLTAPPGQRLESTVGNVASVEAIMAQAAGRLDAVMSEIGDIEQDDRVIREDYRGENTAEIRFKLQEGEQSRNELIAAAMPALEQLYGTDIDWLLAGGFLTEAFGEQNGGLRVELAGQSLEGLRLAAQQLKQRMQRSSLLWNVQTSFDGAPGELHLQLNRQVADSLGIDAQTVSDAVAAALDGLKVTNYHTGDETRDITLVLPDIDAERLLNFPISGESGRLFTVGDVARLTEAPGAREILRRDQSRIAEVRALVATGHANPAARAELQQILTTTELPAGIRAKLAGQEQQRLETTAELSWAAVLALLLVLMVLAGCFESVLAPLAILPAIPLALIGVAIVLVPVGEPIGVMAMLGFVVLIGVAVNDAILLVQTTNSLRDEGGDYRSILAKAVRIRLRPIIMTTLTAVFSMLPLAVDGGAGAQLRSPLAWTIIGGVMASTLGCLTVTPCLLLLLERLRLRYKSPAAVAHEPG